MAIDTSKMYSRTQGFNIASASPIEHRLILTKAQMVAYENDATFMPEAYFCICLDDNTFYTFKKESNGKGKFTPVISAGSLTTALQYRGSINGTDSDSILASITEKETSLSNVKVGYVYNLLDASEIDGINYPAGTNIAVSEVTVSETDGAITISLDPLGNSYSSEIEDINAAITAINSADYVNKLTVSADISTSYTLRGVAVNVIDTLDIKSTGNVEGTGHVTISGLKTLSIEKNTNYTDKDVLQCIWSDIVDSSTENGGTGGRP